jgi:Tol biopolymer transport system component
MGEVYRARDTRLGRDVAIKFLPEIFLRDPDRQARFEREARALAALNHPHIAQLYGVEESAGVHALVMELVEGPTLAERIAAGPLSVADTIAIARQIADALDCAHEHAIVHRDLKPANVKVRDDGTVKVLDFGLAKAMGAGGGGATDQPAANSPTFTTPAMTELGMILGTAAYMAPEQARGKSVDHHADVWAFGVIVFEMLTGRQLFAGDTVSDTLAAVLREEIPWSTLPPIPPALRRMLDRCLQKDPKRRLHSIADARFDLDEAASGPGRGDGAAASRRGRGFAWLAWSAAALASAAAVALWISGSRAPAKEPRWQQFTQVTDTEGDENDPSISPDGKSVAYASRARGSWDIYVQRIGGRNPIVAAGDPDRDETAPAFSPDGQTIAYDEAGGKGGIFIAGATGESSRRLTDFGFDPAWSPDGKHIVFATERVIDPSQRLSQGTLWVVDPAGGTPRKIQDVDAVQPAWSPSGARIAFWSVHGGQRDIYTMPAEGGVRVPLLEDAALDWSPVWSPDGRFLYFGSDRGGSMNIWRMAIDEKTGRTSGSPEIVTTGVQSSIARPTFSADGARLAFQSHTESINPVALPFDPSTGRPGTAVVLGNRTGTLIPTDVSRDGKHLLLTNIGERREDIFTCAIDGTGLRRLTDDAARDRFPFYMPDGRILFFSNRSGRFEIYTIASDGGGLRLLATHPDADLIFTFVSPSADRVVATLFGGRDPRIRPVVATLGGGPAVDWTDLKGADDADGGRRFVPREWSRDGRRMAGFLLVSGSATQAGVAIYDVAAGKRTDVSSDSPRMVRWLPDSRHVVYVDQAHNEVVLIDVDSGARVASRLSSSLMPYNGGFGLAPDARTIYFGGVKSETDIWIVEKK